MKRKKIPVLFRPLHAAKRTFLFRQQVLFADLIVSGSPHGAFHSKKREKERPGAFSNKYINLRRPGVFAPFFASFCDFWCPGAFALMRAFTPFFTVVHMAYCGMTKIAGN